jgi:hypothetical protein
MSFASSTNPPVCVSYYDHATGDLFSVSLVFSSTGARQLRGAPFRSFVGKLWNLCNALVDDGVAYHQHLTELTYRLVLKMATEADTESQIFARLQLSWRSCTLGKLEERWPLPQ